MKDSHAMHQHFNFSLAEINAMTPWEMDVRCQLILIDQEKEKEKGKKNMI
jgi:hypothetical protein